MSKAVIKYYFIAASLIATLLVFVLLVYKGIYRQEVMYICTAILSTSTIYAYLLNKETFGKKIAREIGFTFLLLMTLWLVMFCLLMLWRATDIFSKPLSKDDLSYYFAGLEAFKLFFLSTMMPKIFPDQ